MGDHQRGATHLDAVQLGLDGAFGLGIQRRGGLVEDQDARVLEDRPGDGHPLLLATGELQAALAHRGLVTVRQAFDEAVDVRGACGGLDLFPRRLGAAVADVVVDAVVEQHRVLRNDADGAAQRGLGQLAQVVAVDGDAPLADVIEAVQQARQGGFARTRMADHRHGAAGGNLEVHAVQDLPARVVAEAHALEAHGGPAAVQGHGIRRVLHILALVEQAEQAFHVGQRLFHFAVHHAEQEQRRGQLQQVGVDQHQVADRHAAGHHAGGGQPHHRGDADGNDRRLTQVEHRQAGGGLDLGFFQGAQVLVVTRGLVGLVVEVLDRLVVEQRIHRALVGTGIGLHRGAVVAGAPFGNAEGPHRVGHQRGQGHGGEAPVIDPDQHHGDQQHFQQDRDDRIQGPVQQVGDRRAAALHIAGHPAGAPAEVKLQAQRVQVAEHLQRHLPRSARHDPGEHHLAQLGEQRDADARGAVGEQQADRQQQQAGFDVEVVDDVLENERHQQVEQLGGEHQAQRQQDAADVGLEIGQQVANHGNVAARLLGALDGRDRSVGGHGKESLGTAKNRGPMLGPRRATRKPTGEGTSAIGQHKSIAAEALGPAPNL